MGAEPLHFLGQRLGEGAAIDDLFELGGAVGAGGRREISRVGCVLVELQL